MTLVGSLAGTLDGRPWSLESADTSLTIRLAGLTSPLSLRRGAKQLLRRIAPVIPPLDGRVWLKLGHWPAIPLGSVSRLLWLLGVDRAFRGSSR